MNLLQTIKDIIRPNDKLDETVKQLLQKKESIMLGKLEALFPEKNVQNVTNVLNSVANFVAFLDQQLQGDPAKVNEAIEHLKAIFETHKRS